MGQGILAAAKCRAAFAYDLLFGASSANLWSPPLPIRGAPELGEAGYDPYFEHFPSLALSLPSAVRKLAAGLQGPLQLGSPAVLCKQLTGIPREVRW